MVKIQNTERQQGLDNLQSQYTELQSMTLDMLKNMDNAQAKTLLEIGKNNWSTIKTRNDWSSIPLVYALQKASGAKMDGIIGPETRGKIKSIIGVDAAASLSTALDNPNNWDILIAKVSDTNATTPIISETEEQRVSRLEGLSTDCTEMLTDYYTELQNSDNEETTEQAISKKYEDRINSYFQSAFGIDNAYNDISMIFMERTHQENKDGYYIESSRDIHHIFSYAATIEIQKQGAVKDLWDTYGIRNFHRYDTQQLLKQLNERSQQENPTLIAYAQVDHNGYFNYSRNDYREINDKVSTPVVIYEVGNTENVFDMIKKEYEKRGNKLIKQMYIGGHGGTDHIQLSTRDELTQNELERYKDYKKYFENDAHIILESSSTGAMNGVAQEMSRILEVEVSAPNIVTYGYEDIITNSEGKFKGAVPNKDPINKTDVIIITYSNGKKIKETPAE